MVSYEDIFWGFIQFILINDTLYFKGHIFLHALFTFFFEDLIDFIKRFMNVAASRVATRRALRDCRKWKVL